MDMHTETRIRTVSQTTTKLLVALALAVAGGIAFAVVQNQPKQQTEDSIQSQIINKKPLVVDPKTAVEAVNNFSGIVRSVHPGTKHSVFNVRFSAIDSNKVTSDMIEQGESLPMIDKDMVVLVNDHTSFIQTKEKDIQEGDFIYIEIEGNIYTDDGVATKIELIQKAQKK